jgi:hypothetical protein
MTVDGGGPADGVFEKDPAWFAPYIDPGRPPCADGKYDPPGVAEGGGGATLLYGCWL